MDGVNGHKKTNGYILICLATASRQCTITIFTRVRMGDSQYTAKKTHYNAITAAPVTVLKRLPNARQYDGYLTSGPSSMAAT